MWLAEATGVSRSCDRAAGSAVGELTVVVVNWELPILTIRCVRSIVDDGVAPERIAVVDNGSSEACWAQITGALSSSVLIRLDRNVGFARANNIAARVLPGSAFLLVNNDAFVHRAGSVGTLLAALEREDVGIIVPRVLNEDLSLQPTVVPFTTPSVALARASGLSRFIPDRFQPRWSTHWTHDVSREIEAANGAVMLVRGDLWSELGGLAEWSFMYAEDLDLCWRAHEQGWKSRFVSEAEFVHVGSASAAVRWSDPERAQRVAQAEGRMIRTHLARPKAGVAIGFVRLGHAARAFCYTVVRNEAAAVVHRALLSSYGRCTERDPEVRSEDPVVEVLSPRPVRGS